MPRPAGGPSAPPRARSGTAPGSGGSAGRRRAKARGAAALHGGWHRWRTIAAPRPVEKRRSPCGNSQGEVVEKSVSLGKRKSPLLGALESGAEGARTPDLLAASQTLSQLSYGPASRRSV